MTKNIFQLIVNIAESLDSSMKEKFLEEMESCLDERAMKIMMRYIEMARGDEDA
jgi:hypothetical protein